MEDGPPPPVAAPQCPHCNKPLSVVDGVALCEGCDTTLAPEEPEPEPDGKYFDDDDEIVHIDPAEENRLWDAVFHYLRTGEIRKPGDR